MSSFLTQALLAISLLAASAVIYLIHFTVFGDPRTTVNYLVGNIAFLPVEALLVTFILHRMLSFHEKKARQEKLSTLIGVFFSDVGRDLMKVSVSADAGIDALRPRLMVTAEWKQGDYQKARRALEQHQFTLDQARVDCAGLRRLALMHQPFVMRLMENPYLLEHGEFTELLLALLHLTDELSLRGETCMLSGEDLKHVVNDLRRVYTILVRQWLDYMRYQQTHYPYLFSLAVRTNPFDRNSSVVIS